MTDQARTGARLLFRVEPIPLESPRGYLCRVVQAHGYDNPLWLAQLAGLSVGELEQRDHAHDLAHVLRLEPREWLVMPYRHVKGIGRFRQQAFCGQTVRTDQLNYRRPRICPECLRERPVWWAVWDLALVAACPKHGCLLINRCTACGKNLVWQRPAVEKCRCGADLRAATSEAANPDLVAMSTLIYLAAGFPPGAAAKLALEDYHFPPDLRRLALGSLLRLIRFLGLTMDKDRLRWKQRPFPRTDLLTAIQAGRAAILILREWPRSFREILRRMLPPDPDNPATLNFSEIFGNFYRHLFHVLPRREFGFLHDACEGFVIEEWKGLIRGQHRHFSKATRQNSPWVTVNAAERLARTYGDRITDLVRQGRLEGIFLSSRPGGRRTECWIRRESLNQWIAARDAELAQYMSRPEAQRVLGLKNVTVQAVAEAGLSRYVQGPERNFPYGFHFLREDILKIRHAFEKYPVPVREYSKPGELIALRHALKDYLGRDSGLPAVIRAVLDGALAPAAYTGRFPGITGYLFPSEQLRRYRPVPDVEAPPEGFLNYREAASALGVKAPVIRAMVAQRILSAPAGYRSGLSKLVPAADIQRFAERYVATSVLASQFHLNSGSLARYLRGLGTPLLAIPSPDAGKGHAFFLCKDVAARTQLPSRRMLRKLAQLRIKAYKKKLWAERRLAKEKALGRPLRRVRAKCRHSGNAWKCGALDAITLWERSRPNVRIISTTVANQ